MISSVKRFDRKKDIVDAIFSNIRTIYSPVMSIVSPSLPSPSSSRLISIPSSLLVCIAIVFSSSSSIPLFVTSPTWSGFRPDSVVGSAPVSISALSSATCRSRSSMIRGGRPGKGKTCAVIWVETSSRTSLRRSQVTGSPGDNARACMIERDELLCSNE